MKKTIAILLALLMALSLLACGAEKNGMPNPMKKVDSLDKLSEKANCALVKPTGVTLTDEAYYMIDGDPQIAQYSFKVDGTECFLRFANVDITTDISGLYRGDGTLFADTEAETTYIEDDDLKAQRWVTVDGQYIFVVQDKGAWDWTAFDALNTQFRDMEPKNWKADVPFAVYKAMEGSYADESGDVWGAVNIVHDHVGLYVAANQEDGSRLYWEIEAVLKGSELVYDKEIISRIIYDEASGVSSTEAIGEGGAGSVEVNGDTLIFANAASEQLKGVVLTMAKG